MTMILVLLGYRKTVYVYRKVYSVHESEPFTIW